MTAPVDVAPVERPAEALPRAAPAEPTLLQRLTARSAWPAWANAVAVVGFMLVALSQLHPSLLVANTTTAGGDTGGHVMLPAFLKSHLLAHGQLTGWDPDWYDGFPLYTFYFPLPGLVTVVFNAVMPYDVAFKWVTVLGTLLLPLCAWAFGRLAGLRNPGPACLAAATLPFLFEPSFSIYGGNLLSTMAGEFSFSLSLSLALLFLGVVALGLRTGHHRGLAAVLFAATLLSHLLPALFAAAGAVVLVLLDADLVRGLRRGLPARRARRRWARRLLWAVAAGLVGLGLTAWWLVPFIRDQPYATNMGWRNVEGFPHLLFPASVRWVLAADLLGLVAMVLRRNRVAWCLAILGGLSAAAVCLDPQGKLYNVRFLPMWFLCLYLMAGYALFESISALARWNRRRRLARWVPLIRARLTLTVAGPWRPGSRISRFRRPTPGPAPPGAVAGPLIALAAACLATVPPLVLPASALSRVGVTVGANQPSAWATWNYSGYQRKPDYAEYHAVLTMMNRVGAEHGCGRAMWEYDPSLNRFGTTMSLMLLPYWTNGCIASMEGTLFESSATTPFHFLNQNELSVNPSDAVSGLPYGGLNVPLGIAHLQQLGVRYFLASSSTVERAAGADPSVTEVASSGPWSTIYNGETLNTTWKVYAVKDSGLVQPLFHQPVVWRGVSPDQSSWLNPAVRWYDTPSRWGVVPTAGGPTGWARVPVGDPRPAAVPVAGTTVTGVRVTDRSISFHVDRVGTPVEVKMSYFPNWRATGADGPWRAAPNLMVVVPTSHQVTLDYRPTASDRIGQLITLVSVVVALALALGERRARRRTRSAAPNF